MLHHFVLLLEETHPLQKMAIHFLENAYKGKAKTVLVNVMKAGAEVSSTHS